MPIDDTDTPSSADPGRTRPRRAQPRTHYDTLGVDADASPAAVRDAYRRAARRVHPDRQFSARATLDAVADDLPTMADLNEAYRVVGNPASRASYDRRLADDAEPTTATEASVGHVRSRGGTTPAVSRWLARLLSPPGPARYPIRLILVAAAVSIVAMLAWSSRPAPPSVPTVDGLIEPGSCVLIDGEGDAIETPCSGRDNDLVVASLVGLDRTCASDQTGYRDRNGLAIVCLAAP